jgi:3',5'-cyclic AMP phosphodiesterase CpdA
MLTRRHFIVRSLLTFAAVFVSGALSAAPWSFGVISDTQWQPVKPENCSVAIHIVDAVNREFIAAKVELVLQVGDLCDDGSNAGLDMRAAHNRALAEAGIPFYPVRGNHDGSLRAAIHFGQAFPRLPGTSGGGGGSPPLPGAAGHTYAFVHNDAKFILLDQFAFDDGSPKGRAYTVADYLPWIERELSADDHKQAFVLGHKPLLGQAHKDNLFGADDSAEPDAQNVFYACLCRHGVRYYICGHDHLHHRSLLTSPDGRSTVEQIIGQSDSFKLYTPRRFPSPRIRDLSEERNKVGYYIYTIDGPRVTGRYYSTAPFGNAPAKPTWELRDTFGYCLDGK